MRKQKPRKGAGDIAEQGKLVEKREASRDKQSPEKVEGQNKR